MLNCNVLPRFVINNVVITEVDRVKYLGHVICNDRSDDDDMMRQRRQLYAQGNVISRRFHMCSAEVKNRLFCTFCTQLYTCHLWWNYTARSWQKLKVSYNNSFCMMHRLPTYCSASLMFVTNRVPDCRSTVRHLTYRFINRLDSSSHIFIRNILSSDLQFVSRIRQHWMQSLFVYYDGGWIVVLLFFSLG